MVRFALLALVGLCLFVADASAFHGRQRVVVRQQVVRQQVVVQRVVAAPVVVQQFHAQPVYAQQFVAPVYSQQFVAPAVVAPGCSAFFVK